MSPEEIQALRSQCDRALHWHGLPTPQDFLGDIDVEAGIDRYGAGGAVTALETMIREMLGKPAAVFMPSGTMAQQIALRVHADARNRRAIGFHPTSHLEIHEDKAYQRLHGLVGVPVGDARDVITLDDVRAVREPLAAMLFELPQREIGGRLPEWEDLRAQTQHVRAGGAAVHLDGARLWECTPYYRKTLDEIAGLFDTVYVSFYKGIGALAGCCLAGDEDVIEQARAWQWRHGGRLWSMWPNAASALGAVRRRLPLMPRYYEHAQAIAAALREVPGVEVVPDPPHTPMMHVHLQADADTITAGARAIAEQDKIFTWLQSFPTDSPSVRRVELTVGDATMTFAPDEVVKLFERLLAGG